MYIDRVAWFNWACGMSVHMRTLYVVRFVCSDELVLIELSKEL